MKITMPAPLTMALETLCSAGLSIASFVYAVRSGQGLIWYLWGVLCAAVAIYLGVTHARELVRPSLTVSEQGLVCCGEFAWLGTLRWRELSSAAVRRVRGRLVLELSVRDGAAFCAERGKDARKLCEADGTLPVRIVRRGLTSMAQARDIGAEVGRRMGCVV
ncbi:MAG: hypothetical protein ABT01_00420 [Clostridium sp. SCN 57-10]|nr:MAG: hypothetical protein ABT01_00420 [Clostridium sp. SCN 57-10]